MISGPVVQATVLHSDCHDQTTEELELWSWFLIDIKDAMNWSYDDTNCLDQSTHLKSYCSGDITGWLVSALEGWWTATQPLSSIPSSPSAVGPQPFFVLCYEEFFNPQKYQYCLARYQLKVPQFRTWTTLSSDIWSEFNALNCDFYHQINLITT